MAVISGFLGIFVGFWDSSGPNHHLLLGVYLLLVSSITVASLSPKVLFPYGLRGASLFGICYLLIVLRGGFGLETIYDSQTLERKTIIGFGLIGLAFFTSHFWTILLTPGATNDNSEQSAD